MVTSSQGKIHIFLNLLSPAYIGGCNVCWISRNLWRQQWTWRTCWASILWCLVMLVKESTRSWWLPWAGQQQNLWCPGKQYHCSLQKKALVCQFIVTEAHLFFVLCRCLPLWVGARGIEFDWKYIQMSFDSNISLVSNYLLLLPLCSRVGFRCTK